MTVPTDQFLRRLSTALRGEIAPAVGDEYTRTQAFMASVILERLSRQLELAPAHGRAEEADMGRLLGELNGVLSGAPNEVVEAMEGVQAATAVAPLGPLIEALYQWGVEQPAVVNALSMIRPVLRRDIDRKMEIAR